MPAEFTNQYPVLPVADVRASMRWYRDVLGFGIDWTEGDEFGAVSSGAVTVFFSRAEPPVAPILLVWNTTDADAMCKAFRTKGATIVEEPTTQPWGMREFLIEDPDGHRMRIGHVDESEADYGSFAGPDGKPLAE